MTGVNIKIVKSINVNANPYYMDNLLREKIYVNTTILYNICGKERPKYITIVGNMAQ